MEIPRVGGDGQSPCVSGLPHYTHHSSTQQMNAARRASRASRKRNPAPRRRNARAASTASRRPTPSASSTEVVGPYATVGRDIGGILGFAPLGERIGGAIGRLFGKGDYSVLGNSLMESYGKPAAGPPPPALFRSGKRGTRIVEREYIGDIRSGSLTDGSSIFNNNSFAINPGVSTTFPWLSKVARQFDQWEPHGIVFEFRSTSSEYNGSTQALGTVILATDYDAVDSPYTSKVLAENSDYAMSVKASDCAIHGIECAPGERPSTVLFTRAADRPPGTDPRLYDLGLFQIATQGMSAANVNLGELWVSYDITFYKKQLNSGEEPDDSNYFSFTYSPVGTTSDYFGRNNGAYRNWGNWDNTSYVSTTEIFLPPFAQPGTVFALECHWTASSGTPVLPTFTPSNCSLVYGSGLFDGGASSDTYLGELQVSGAAVQAVARHFYVVTAPNAKITCSSGTLSNITSTTTMLTQLPSGVPYSRQPVA